MVKHKLTSFELPTTDEITPAHQLKAIFLDQKLAGVDGLDLEKQDYHIDKERDIEDLDALIRELDSADPEEEAEKATAATDLEAIPLNDLCETDPARGLSTSEVLRRRNKFGLNQLKEDKENLFLKFVLFFVGPIQFVMEVSNIRSACFFF